MKKIQTINVLLAVSYFGYQAASLVPASYAMQLAPLWKRSMFERFIPTILVVLQAMSAVPYFWTGDWRKGLYWCFAAGLTTVVTY